MEQVKLRDWKVERTASSVRWDGPVIGERECHILDFEVCGGAFDLQVTGKSASEKLCFLEAIKANPAHEDKWTFSAAASTGSPRQFAESQLNAKRWRLGIDHNERNELSVVLQFMDGEPVRVASFSLPWVPGLTLSVQVWSGHEGVVLVNHEVLEPDAYPE